MDWRCSNEKQLKVLSACRNYKIMFAIKYIKYLQESKYIYKNGEDEIQPAFTNISIIFNFLWTKLNVLYLFIVKFTLL